MKIERASGRTFKRQNYRAVVIDLKGFSKRAVILLLTAAVAVGAIWAARENSFVFPKSPDKILQRTLPPFDSSDSPHKTMAELLKTTADKTVTLVLGFTPSNRTSIIGGSIPVFAAVYDGGLIAVTEPPKSGQVLTGSVSGQEQRDNIPSNIPEENRALIKSIDAAQKAPADTGIAIGNETSYSINVGEMLASPPSIDISGSEPRVLITHTHATESYSDSGAEFYDVTAGDRSEDTDKNVVAVGSKMAEVLEQHGIKTLHDTILHDVPSFNGSYAHSLNTVQEYLSEYPSIQMVFDVHRDSIVYDDKTKAKVVTEINGAKTAQLMFVVGTDEKGLYHPNWRSNMQTALCFQKAITAKYPKLMRYVNLRRERFNGHTTNASMIIEVGTSGNSLDEALRGIELAAACIADYLKSLS